MRPLEVWIPRIVGMAIIVLSLLGGRCLVAATHEPRIEALADALHQRLLVPASVEHGRPYAWRHCREAPQGCRARVRRFASYFFYVGRDTGIEPELLAAIAWEESRLNPWVEGRAGSRGIMQLHPSRKEARQLDIFSEQKRAQCRETFGACQLEVVTLAAKLLQEALDACRGDLPKALGAYNSGKCVASRYSRRVLRTRRELRGSREAA